MKTLKLVLIILIFQAGCGNSSRPVLDESIWDVSGVYRIIEGERYNYDSNGIEQDADVAGLHVGVLQNDDIVSVANYCFGKLKRQNNHLIVECHRMSGYQPMFKIWSGHGFVIFRPDNTMSYVMVLNAFYPRSETEVYSSLVFKAEMDEDFMNWTEEIIPK